MAATTTQRDPPEPGRAETVEADRFDPEHPKRPLHPVTVSTKPLARAARDLGAFRSTDAPVVSVYWSVPADFGQARGAVAALKDLAKPVRERAASRDLSHAARESLLADADRLLELELLASELDGRTLAFFHCSAHGLEEAVALPGDHGDLVALDETPYIRPLLEVLEESHRYAVVVVDREHGLLFEFYLGVLEARERDTGRVLKDRKHPEADKELRVRDKAENLAKQHYREVAHDLDQLVQRDQIELVVIGGHEDSIPPFSEELPAELRHKVVGTFVVDPHTMTPGAVREAAQGAVDDYERREEADLVQQVLDRVGAGGFGALGLEWCLLATDEQAVDVLLLEPDVVVPGRVCDRCGWLGLAGDECPVDGNPTRATPDVLDDMARRVFDSSGRVEHVHADTPLREHTVGALLRFPVPRPEPAEPAGG